MIAYITPFAPELIFSLFILFLIVFPFWKIFKKAGYHGALSLIMLIPFGILIMTFFLAFARWPILKKHAE